MSESAFEIRKTIYYLESIQRQLTDVAGFLGGPSLGGEILADNRDWLDCYIDHLRAASQWQPIETAPKDGTPILVCDPGTEEPWIVRWQVGKRKQGWNHWTGFVSWNPTLWSPLLKPPAAPSEIGRY